MTCKHYIHNRAIDRPHICNHDGDHIVCPFACDWNLASKRCTYYENTSKWAVFAISCGNEIRISQKFETDADARSVIKTWMINVVIKECND